MTILPKPTIDKKGNFKLPLPLGLGSFGKDHMEKSLLGVSNIYKQIEYIFHNYYLLIIFPRHLTPHSFRKHSYIFCWYIVVSLYHVCRNFPMAISYNSCSWSRIVSFCLKNNFSSLRQVLSRQLLIFLHRVIIIETKWKKIVIYIVLLFKFDMFVHKDVNVFTYHYLHKYVYIGI